MLDTFEKKWTSSSISLQVVHTLYLFFLSNVSSTFNLQLMALNMCRSRKFCQMGSILFFFNFRGREGAN